MLIVGVPPRSAPAHIRQHVSFALSGNGSINSWLEICLRASKMALFSVRFRFCKSYYVPKLMRITAIFTSFFFRDLFTRVIVIKLCTIKHDISPPALLSCFFQACKCKDKWYRVYAISYLTIPTSGNSKYSHNPDDGRVDWQFGIHFLQNNADNWEQNNQQVQLVPPARRWNG